MDTPTRNTSGEKAREAEAVNAGAISLTWEPGIRLATLRFAEPTIGTGPAAQILVKAITGWAGANFEPFGLLADAKNNPSVDAHWRSTWTAFLKIYKASMIIAVFNMGAVARITAELFRIGVGLNLKGFSQEKDARAWLKTQGIRA